MDIKKTIKIGMLNDYYGSLLTKKEQGIVEDYFNNNISLGEIGENLKITRQAVKDTLNRATDKLLLWEKQLKLLKKQQMQKDILCNVENGISKELIKKILSVWEIEWAYFLV